MVKSLKKFRDWSSVEEGGLGMILMFKQNRGVSLWKFYVFYALMKSGTLKEFATSEPHRWNRVGQIQARSYVHEGSRKTSRVSKFGLYKRILTSIEISNIRESRDLKHPVFYGGRKNLNAST